MTFSSGAGEGKIKEGFLEEEALNPSHCRWPGAFPPPTKSWKGDKDKAEMGSKVVQAGARV